MRKHETVFFGRILLVEDEEGSIRQFFGSNKNSHSAHLSPQRRK